MLDDEKLLLFHERESKLFSTLNLFEERSNWSKDKAEQHNQLFEHVIHELLSEKVPTNIVYAKCIDLAQYQIPSECILFLLQSDTLQCHFIGFHDLRDAVEFYTKIIKITQNNNDLFKYCCPSAVQILFGENITSRDFSLSLTISDSQVPFEIFELISRVQENLESIGPCQISSNVFQSVSDKMQLKFFVEFYDARLIPTGIRKLEKLSISGCKVKYQSCNLTLSDRQYLLYNGESFEDGSPLMSNGLVPNGMGRIEALPSSLMNDSKQEYEVNFIKIELGEDLRTTCMIRNIPNKYTQQMLIDMINETHFGTYDFIYLRMDFKNKCNVGYAFINFIDCHHITSFGKRVMGKRWPRFNSDKVCHISYARIQGKQSLIEKFRHSKVMMEPASYRPKIYINNGVFRGQEEPFPY